jgi:hypothetical protein
VFALGKTYTNNMTKKKLAAIFFSFLWLKETRTNSVCTRQNVHNQYDKKEAANNFSYNQQVMG